MKMLSPAAKTTLINSAKHPLTLLLLGTLITSWLVPIYNNRQLKAERRKNLVYDLCEYNSNVSSKLYAVKTNLELFDKDAKVLSDTLLYQRQLEMQRTTNDMYLDFDKIAWWGTANLRVQFQWNEPGQSGLIDSLFNAYIVNIKASTDCLSTLWDFSLRTRDYHHCSESQQLINQTGKTMDSLRFQRLQIVTDLSNLVEKI